MIVSHKHQFIFIKTKKTAGTSIEIALSAICGNADIITPINKEDEELRKEIAGITAQNYIIPYSKYTVKDWLRFIKNKKRLTYYNHMPASKLKKYLDETIWDRYYKFCFERDPVKKSISHYKWRGTKKNYDNFEDYLFSKDVELIKGDYFYKDRDDNYLVDKVYKMEEMDDSFNELEKILNLPKNTLKAPHFNTKKTKNTNINIVELKNKYKETFLDIFKTEYKDLYSI